MCSTPGPLSSRTATLLCAGKSSPQHRALCSSSPSPERRAGSGSRFRPRQDSWARVTRTLPGLPLRVGMSSRIAPIPMEPTAHPPWMRSKTSSPFAARSLMGDWSWCSLARSRRATRATLS
eukprot:Amastigsp_a177061_10.p4 type:complete len:121 gc:universal Amastigsp_a177061_10:1052-690(-)